MSIFAPSRYVSSVERIDLAELKARGKQAILLDRDNTLVPRDRKSAPPEVVAWLDKARDLGFSLYMVSNNWHRDQVERSSSELGLQAIAFACKPLPFALDRALAHLGIERDRAVMVGDQLYTDVWAGNFAGIESILVQPQTTVDLWYTKIFRVFERRALKNVPLEK